MTEKIRRGSTEKGAESLAGAFESALAVEMLESQALRTRALGITFAVVSVFVLVEAFTFYERYGWQTALAPATVFAFASSVSLLEFAMHRAIRRYIRIGISVPAWIWYANAFAEITVMSAIMIVGFGAFSNPVYTLSSPPLAGYFLFIVLSTLYLDARLSLFIGGLAAIQYLMIVVFAFSRFGATAADDPIFLTPGLYLGKTCILLLAGVGAAFVARELSRRNRSTLSAVEERDREHRANTLKTQFLADMSHEIRTPLNAIVGYAQLLETEPGTTPGQRKAVEAIRVSGRHLLSVVNDVLDISKIEAGGETVQRARFNLTTLLRELTLVFAARCAEKKISWVFDMKTDAEEVVGDEAKLRQALTNILGNAVKFTQSGQVALRVEATGQDIYRFEVEDTGPGVAPERQIEIFDPFAQDVAGRLSGGTGLGLSIAQRYVRLMGGEIEIDSAPGEGARFRFSIPLGGRVGEIGAGATKPARTAMHLSPGQSVRALVADDLAANRDVLTRMLENAGIGVTAVETGAEALDAISGARHDIAFLDIRMPDLSGTEVARRIVESGPKDLKLVAVSASALVHQQAEYRAAGFDGFLDKPVQIASLYNVISRLLGVSFDAVSAPVVDAGGAATAPMPALPRSLHDALCGAARRHAITDLKRHISELESLGPAESLFAAELQNLCARYDMKAVLSALEAPDNE